MGRNVSDRLLTLRSGEVEVGDGFTIKLKSPRELNVFLHSGLLFSGHMSYPMLGIADAVVLWRVHEDGGKLPFRIDLADGAAVNALFSDGKPLQLEAVKAPCAVQPFPPDVLLKKVCGETHGLSQKILDQYDGPFNPDGSLDFEPVTMNVVVKAYYDPSTGSWKIFNFPDGSFADHPWRSGDHYAAGVITGMKAWQLNDGVSSFRPDKHVERLMRDFKAMHKIDLPREIVMEMLANFVQSNREFVPNAGGENSMYLRFVSGNKTKGIRIAGGYLELTLVGAPVGNYMPARLHVAVPNVPRPVVPSFGSFKTALGYAGPLEHLRPVAGLGGDDKIGGVREMLFGNGVVGMQEGLSAGVVAIFKGKGANRSDLAVIPSNRDVLPSIVTASAEELLRARGYEVVRRRILPKEFFTADEWVMCGTALGAAEVARFTRVRRGRLAEVIGEDRAGSQMGAATAVLRDDFGKILAGHSNVSAVAGEWMQRIDGRG